MLGQPQSGKSGQSILCLGNGKSLYSLLSSSSEGLEMPWAINMTCTLSKIMNEKLLQKFQYGLEKFYFAHIQNGEKV